MFCFPHYLRDIFLLKKKKKQCMEVVQTPLVYTVFEKNSSDCVVRIQQMKLKLQQDKRNLNTTEALSSESSLP